MKSDLKGKVILVTGASGGIGSAVARRFAEEGARVMLHYHRNRTGAEELRHELAGTETLVTRADLTKEADVIRLFQRTVEKFGRVDTLIANAGSWESRDVPLQEMSLRQWNATQTGVLTSTFLCLREFFRRVAKQKQGNAVLISSTSGVFGEAGHADYSAAKSAMAYGLTRSLKNEIARLAPHTAKYCGGRVNCVCPGWTVVPRTAAKLRDRKNVGRVVATMALPQIARPDDMAHAVVFLSSDTLARHLTGQTLVIAGGMEGRRLWEPAEVDFSAV
jgi:3-oxoacyl-[acyl-carrier protein] reductase